jgi:hypothetical protein
MPGKKKPNRFEHLPNGSTVIFITRKNGAEYQAVIDTKDFPLVRRHRWGVDVHDQTTYACSTQNGKWIYLHRFLLPGFVQVDHKDLDGLNNRRNNLRGADSSQNCANQRKQRGKTSSIYKGVSWKKSRKRYRAKCRGVDIGTFKTEEAAALKYDLVARNTFGPFARLNILSNEPPHESGRTMGTKLSRKQTNGN